MVWQTTNKKVAQDSLQQGCGRQFKKVVADNSQKIVTNEVRGVTIHDKSMKIYNDDVTIHNNAMTIHKEYNKQFTKGLWHIISKRVGTGNPQIRYATQFTNKMWQIIQKGCDREFTKTCDKL